MTHMDQVRQALENGCTTRDEIAAFTGLSKPRVKSAINNAKARGQIPMASGGFKLVEPKREPAVWRGPMLSEWRPYPKELA